MKLLKAFWKRLSTPSKAAAGILLFMGFAGGLLPAPFAGTIERLSRFIVRIPWVWIILAGPRRALSLIVLWWSAFTSLTSSAT